jgi:xanthine dehydrogenase accessory factor
MISATLADREQQLHDARTPFVVATVVRAQRPTSVRPGDSALVLGDGAIEGFVGGVCAEESVRLHAARVLETGEPLLLRLTPEPGDGEQVIVDGAVTAHNPCLSGGGLEIFLQPQLPAPRLAVVGDAPVARALAVLGPGVGFEVTATPSGDDAALVVASHGRDEQTALETALTEGVPYVALVASTRRGGAVRTALDVPDALSARLHTPAGLDIGARTAQEIALSILAEIVQERRTLAPRPAGGQAADPPAAGECCQHHGAG